MTRSRNRWIEVMAYLTRIEPVKLRQARGAGRVPGAPHAGLTASRWPRHPPQRQVDPAAVRRQRRAARHDPVDAVEGEPRFAAQHQGITGGEAERAGGIAALGPADAKQATVAE